MVVPVGNIRLAPHDYPVFHPGQQGNDLGRGRNDLALDPQHLADRLDRLQETAGLLGQCRQDQVAQVVAADIFFRPVRICEPVVHQFAHQRFTLGQGDHDRPDITHGRDMELAPQPAGAAAVIRHRDNGGDVQPLDVLDAPADGRLAVAAADDDDVLTHRGSSWGRHGAPDSSCISSGNDYTDSWQWSRSGAGRRCSRSPR